MNSLGAIILFVYNRPWHTRQTVEALQRCELATESDLYIFADGLKADATEEQKNKIHEVRNYIHTIAGFHSVIIEESETNMGLANSIIVGVSKILDIHGKVIVLEDDIVVSSGFLKYMNSALDIYEQEQNVMHIAGYMYPLRKNALPETFFYPAVSCWGWATWKRAWNHFNGDALYLYNKIKEDGLLDILNINTIHGFEEQLRANAEGKLNTWFIKWNASVIVSHGYSLYPKKSLVQNVGFDSSGEHCGITNQFWCPHLAESIKVKKQNVVFNKRAIRLLKQFGEDGKSSYFSYLKRKIKNGKNLVKKFLLKIIRKIIKSAYPEIELLTQPHDWIFIDDFKNNNQIGPNVKIYSPSHISESSIGDYTYIAMNPYISMTKIGKYCSIGPNFFCGWGIHPTNGISTSPMFYSTGKQNGITLSNTDKIEERKPIVIGNDVFIGANVTVLDGVNIGDGAVIGAGAVVSKDIPPYAIAAGCPIKIIRFRFDNETISALEKIKWWNYGEKEVKQVEELFFDIEKFIQEKNTQISNSDVSQT